MKDRNKTKAQLLAELAELRQRVRHLVLLNDITRAALGASDLQDMLHLLSNRLAELFYADGAYITLWNEARQAFIPAAASGALHTSCTKLSIGPGEVTMTESVLRAGHALIAEDVSNSPYISSRIAALFPARSMLGLPLIADGDRLGVALISFNQPHCFTSDDIALGEQAAGQIALAIAKARLYAQVQRHAADLAGLYALTRATSRTLALEEVLSLALSSALESLEFEAGLICLADAEEGSTWSALEHLRVAADRGLPPRMLELLNDDLEHTLCAYTHRQREIILIRDLAQDAPAHLQAMAAKAVTLGWCAFIGIPLLYHERSLGALCLLSRQPCPSPSYDPALLIAMGQQVGAAVANAQLFQTTLNERSRLQALIKSSRDGIVLNSLDGRILVINAPVLQLLRLPGQPEDWLGRRFSEALDMLRRSAPNVVEITRAEIQRAQSEDESPGEGEFEIPPRTIHWLNLPVIAGLTRLGRLIVLRDVTEQRVIEQMRDDMTLTMVHDLRNPLGNISTTLQVLRSGLLGEVTLDQLAAFKVAETSVRRMLGLVNAILDVNRLESGRMPLEQKAFNLADLVTETLQAQSALANAKCLRLEQAVPTTLPPALADVTLLGRVLQNLTDNACKFTPTGGLVRVTAQAEQSHGRTAILVSIRDTGSGIPAEVRPRLFQKFVRGEQKERGSGLGLAFCKLVLEAHGERIWVESTSEQGTTIAFSLATALGA